MLAFGLFTVVLLLIIWQPKGLQIGTTAVIGALIALALGIVNVNDVKEVVSIVWDATLAFIGIIILSMVLDEIGFFEWAAIKMTKLSHGNGNWMFINILLLGAFVSALFANDGAALILTPILLAKMRYLNMDKKAIFAFLMAGGFIGDSASNPLVISNLTNILTADYFNISFFEYAKNMLLPNFLSIVASISILWLFFRKSIPQYIDISNLPQASSVIKSQTMFKISWVFIILLLIAYFVGDAYKIPVSIFAFGGALIFLSIASKFKAVNPIQTLKSAPWQIVWFSIGLYIVVYGLKNAGLTDEIASILLWLKAQGHTVYVIGAGFLSGILSAIMNNLPTVMIMNISIDKVGDNFLAYANILGANLGPKMTPIGSLATLLWLHILEKKGVKIGWAEYMKIGLIITPPVLFIALLGAL